MLRRERTARQLSFADGSHAAQAVPADHPLLRLKAAADWSAVEDQLAASYDADTGRPSWPPAVLARMLVLEQFADLSDPQVEEQVGYNLLYRAFVGLGPDERVPDATTLVRFRARLGEAGTRRVFETLNRQWDAAGLIDGARRVLDGVHVWANVARASWVGLLRQGRAVVLDAVAAVAPDQVGPWREQYAAPAVPPDVRGDAALEAEAARTRALLTAVAAVDDATVRARVAQVETLLSGEGAAVVSFHDPDARWGHKSEDVRFCGYKAHEALDPESRLITAVDVVPGNANEAVQTDTLLAQDVPGVAPGATVLADGLYNNATTVTQVEAAKATPCFSGLHAERVSDAFEYDAAADQVGCVEGKRSIGKSRVDNGDLYYFSTRDCANCPRRTECLTPGEQSGATVPRRRVYLSDVRKRKVVAGEAGRAWRRGELRAHRYKIEAKFGEQVNRHGLRHARYWGLPKMTAQVLWNAITTNLKRAAKLLARRGVGPPALAASPAGG